MGGENWWRKKREERKRKKERNRGRKKIKRKKVRKRERMREYVASSSDLPAFQRSVFVGPRVKVCLLEEGYAPRIRDYSYLGLFPP